MRNYILGGGISGLIAGYYLGHPVIDKGKDRAPLAPFYLWDKKENCQLIEDLGYMPERKKIKIGYFYNKEFVEPNTKNREKYRKKVGYKSSMSNLKTELNVLENSPRWLINELKKDVDIFPCNVTKINSNKLELNFTSEIRYKKLISTIPLPEFLKLYKLKNQIPDLKYKSISFNYIHFPEIWDTDYDYAYILDGKGLYRATKTEDKGICIGEFLGNSGCKIMKYGKIVSGNLSSDLSDILFLGRFAEWNQQIKIHDVIGSVRSWI